MAANFTLLPDRIGDFLRYYLGEPAEAVLAALVFGFFRILPIDLASALGGSLFRAVGPKLKVSNRARINIAASFPEKSEAEIEAIVRGMWENLGRVVGEYPHLHRFEYGGPEARVWVVGGENVDLLKNDGKPGLFYSAHLGNWELASHSAGGRGLPIHLIYRAPNNRLVEWIFAGGRKKTALSLIPKGALGAKRALQVLRKGEHVGMLVDQKMNDGIAVPFFGREAMTAPALAQFALRYDCPVVAARVERLGGARFKVTLHPPVHVENTGDRHADSLAFMTEVNRTIEGWIRERPEQWLWLHRRWKD